MKKGENLVAALLLFAVLGLAALYAGLPAVEGHGLASVSTGEEGSVGLYGGTVLDLHPAGEGEAFLLVGDGAVRAVSWEGLEAEPGDRVTLRARVDSYEGEPELVVRGVESVVSLEERSAVAIEEAGGGDLVSLNRSVTLSVDGGVVLEGGVFVSGAEASPGEVLRVRGVVTDPGLPKVSPLESEVTGLDESRIHRSVAAAKSAVYEGREGSVRLRGVVGGKRFDWLMYLYDGSTGSARERHVNDVLANEVPLRFPKDYVGTVPEPLDRVEVRGELDSYRGNPQILVRGVEVLGESDAILVSGTAERVEGRRVVVDGEGFYASPGLELEDGEEVSLHRLDGVTWEGEQVGVLAR